MSKTFGPDFFTCFLTGFALHRKLQNFHPPILSLENATLIQISTVEQNRSPPTVSITSTVSTTKAIFAIIRASLLVLPMVLFLSLFLIIFKVTCSANVTTSLHHIRIDRRPVTATRLYSIHNRPWFHLSGQHLNLDPIADSEGPAAYTLRNREKTSQIFSNPLHGSLTSLGEYYVTLTFGGQPLNVQVDTGSSTMAVPMQECTNCYKNSRRFDLSQAKGPASIVPCNSHLCAANSCSSRCGACSSTRACCSEHAKGACAFYLRYADKSATSGALVRADVGISSLVTQLAFGAILEETSSFSNDQVDGIFGLAYKPLACNPTCVNPLLDELVESGKVNHDIFSICTGKDGGVLTLGGSNSDLYEGSLSYVPLERSSRMLFYLVSVSKALVGGNAVDLPYFSSAIIDSGTTLIVISHPTYSALRDYFQSHYCNVPGLCPDGQSRQLVPHPYFPLHQRFSENKNITKDSWEEPSRSASSTWFRPGYCVHLTKSELNLLPTISIALDGYTLEAEPEVYMIPHYITRGFQKKLYYCLGIQPLSGLESFPNDVIIGDAILQKYFVEYDRENSRLGFAVASKCVDSSAVEPASLPHSSSDDESHWVKHGVQVLYLVGTIVIVIIIISCLKPDRVTEGYQPIS